MKIIQIILLILIVIGIGLLFSQQKWLPQVTAFILSKTQPSDYVPVPNTADINTWEWVQSDVSDQGIQFSYPSPIPTQYVQPQSWPPMVSITSEELTCTESGTTELRTIQGTEYCISASMEGAAGSTYTIYDYVTKQGDFLTRVSFMLRRPQCQNYNEPERTDCTNEQENFDVDGLADRIATSITMQ